MSPARFRTIQMVCFALYVVAGLIYIEWGDQLPSLGTIRRELHWSVWWLVIYGPAAMLAIRTLFEYIRNSARQQQA